ncbi:ATP-grasp domain-containing protein [Saccharopolyspora erythraea]|uniref:ATP-grasp domain-containing protein n=1 Tax=Saccharopolyspora erythraea TaxID=1836 RepID=UPI00038C9459|nr:ATP-grasp domain-containing protein [Saccharopolyspora erythraea]EQD83510.1 biotin carboxylase [Saccharopolyspora erythraea D]
MAGAVRNIFVLGLDERNCRLLHHLPHQNEYSFHPLLSKSELMEGEVGLSDYLERAQRELDKFDGSVDAIVGYWDFPVSSMVPILAQRNGLHGPSLESVVKCEHKYWSRLEQQKVTDALPAFALVDLNDAKMPGLRLPFWLKPVKSYSSVLAFRVGNQEDFDHAVAEIRECIGAVGTAFDYVLSMLDLPPEIHEGHGQMCLAEEEVGGQQITAEGYCFGGEPTVYGVVDSMTYPGTSSFLRYQYPSGLPQEVCDRVEEICKQVVRQVGLDRTTFNIEFFWDSDKGDLSILEMNPRLSQSHAPLFEFVDGVANLHAMVRLALGKDPEMPFRRGRYEVAAKWYMRTFKHAFVRSGPSRDDIEQVRRAVPDIIVDIVATEGANLSDVPFQDAYSYELAALYIGARNETELLERFHRSTELLHFDLDEIGRRAGGAASLGA